MHPVVAVAIGLILVTVTPYLIYTGLYLVVRPEGSQSTKSLPEPGNEPEVSIILPTYNEEDIIVRKLRELCELEYPSERMEIVIADDSDDDTAALVQEFFASKEKPSHLLLESRERRGVANAINDAVAASSADILFRTDADSVLGKDVLRQAVGALSDPNVGGVTGCQTEFLGGSAVESEYRNLLTRLQALETWLDSTFIFHGPCSAFEKQAFSPLNEDSLADDTEIAVHIRRKGMRVVMDPTMHFAEAGVSGFRARRGRKDRRAMGLIKLLLQHRDAIGSYGRYGQVVLPFNWWFMLVSPGLIALGIPVVIAAAMFSFGNLGVIVPIGLMALWWFGSRDALGPLQPIWSILDAQASLLIAAFRLLFRQEDGTWAVDRKSREVFE